jgi:chloramphenicol-sensitive protein RarD
LVAPAPLRSPLHGVFFAAGGFVLWGLVPVFWKWMAAVDAAELVAHRVVWSAVLLVPLVVLRGRWREFCGTFRPGGAVRWHLASGLMITGNWLIFVWAVNHDRILETSLGYYLVPLVNVLLGVVVLRERLAPAQLVALGLAAMGVAWQVWAVGGLPWPALGLALTFGGYGLVRKRSPLGSLTGLAVETVLLVPLAALWLGWAASRDALAWGTAGAGVHWGMVATGAITVVPLLLFAEGARRLSLATVGLMQYLTPSMTFVLGVWVYREPVGADRWLSFALIWSALLIYTLHSLTDRPIAPPPARTPAPPAP